MYVRGIVSTLIGAALATVGIMGLAITEAEAQLIDWKCNDEQEIFSPPAGLVCNENCLDDPVICMGTACGGFNPAWCSFSITYVCDLHDGTIYTHTWNCGGPRGCETPAGLPGVHCVKEMLPGLNCNAGLGKYCP